MEQEQKISFLKRMKIAVCNLERYQEFALEKISIAIKYFLKLILIFCAIIGIAITYEFSKILEEGIDVLRNKVPDFSFENKQLTTNTDSPIIIQEAKNGLEYMIIIDTNIDENSEQIKEYEKKLKLYGLGAIFLKDKVLVRTQVYDGLQSYLYANIMEKNNIQDIDKQGLLKNIDNSNLIYIYIAIYFTLILFLYVAYLIATLFETVIMFVLGILVARITKVNLDYKQVYSIVLYALTLPILLNALYIIVNKLTGFEIEFFNIMYTMISSIYLITAILLIKNELIGQNEQLKDIEKVQEEVKRETEERQEDEKESQKKKEKEENKEEKNPGGEPEGST